MACLEGKEVMDRITDMKCESILKCVICVLLTALSVHAENAYTNHAGNVISGWPVKLTATHVTLAEGDSQGRLGGTPRPTGGDQPPTTNYQLPTINYLSTFHLSGIRAATHRSGLRPAVRAGRGEACDRRGGEGDGAFAKARGEGALHEGGERRLLREVRGRAQELP